ncbi:DUF262 domain-containing protein [Agrobacterium bohemicum]|uniref:GmrSD restriction endonucleases N-terminal domain-containing protein n=1 Tax=Agrobacterium bohemicum TaxID=2052828 RepID=A0A135P318_9HYPH|nr:DUF262 domain-containing protein [Agrobacterium bohemicum]KXG85789.1 hypothetical protein ATO67_03900 [Agrobacterium bohemicum]
MFEIQHQQFKSARYWLTRRSQIDLSPSYQRKGGLWRIEDRQALIDTMINGYDMPKLYFADFTTIKSPLNIAGMRYAVIDGKQRINAIFDFLSNSMPLSETFVLEENPNLKLAGMYYKDVAEIAFDFAERVEEFPMPIVHVVTDESAKIRELFLRLNKGIVLTGPEKRNAMIGGVPEAIKELAVHEFFLSSTSYKDDRGESLNNAAKILAFELAGDPVETKRVNLDRMVSELANQAQQLEIAKQDAMQTLDKMSVVFGNRDRMLRSAGSIPAFYWFIRALDVEVLRLVRSYLDAVTTELSGKGTPVFTSADDADRYKSALRNINDKVSHAVRIDILSRGFKVWLSIIKK